MKLEDIFVWNNGLEISGKCAFHFFTTYGFPPEMFFEEANNLIPPFSLERAYIICLAYDKEFNTNYLPRFRELHEVVETLHNEHN